MRKLGQRLSRGGGSLPRPSSATGNGLAPAGLYRRLSNERSKSKEDRRRLLHFSPMPTYSYRCDFCGTPFELQRSIDERAVPFECSECHTGRMRLVPSLPAPPQGSFDSPRSSAYRMQRYTAERLEGKRDGPHGAAMRRLGHEPRPASDSGVTDDRNRG